MWICEQYWLIRHILSRKIILNLLRCKRFHLWVQYMFVEIFSGSGCKQELYVIILKELSIPIDSETWLQLVYA